MKPLTYGSRTMNPEPINTTLADVADALRRGVAVVAELEPGDATYYALLIVPCDAPEIRRSLGRFGIIPLEAYRYIHVTKLDDARSYGAFIRLDGPVGTYDTSLLSSNAWSQQLLAWWFMCLREQLGVDVLTR